MIDKLEGISIKSIALRDSDYFYRKVCRYYSQNFHTPLLEVYEIPWAFVFTNYLEHVIESNNTQEDIYNLAIDVHYPEIVQGEEEELQEWIKQIEEEEAIKRMQKQRKEKKDKKEKAKAKESKPESEKPEPEIHMSEDMFSHLDEEMNDD